MAEIFFDLPWNPQRIEQRIGRCHRYGQKHDVVVINFLNERNKADQRVYELLDQKFNLFTGIFGASDDVLGAIESGVNFERRFKSVYWRTLNDTFNRPLPKTSKKITGISEKPGTNWISGLKIWKWCPKRNWMT